MALRVEVLLRQEAVLARRRGSEARRARARRQCARTAKRRLRRCGDGTQRVNLYVRFLLIDVPCDSLIACDTCR